MGITPDGAPCPECGAAMLPQSEPWTIDLGHTDPEDKRRGLPGDRLEHSSCNRRTMTGWAAGKQAPKQRVELDEVPPVPACKHAGNLFRAPRYAGCPCDRPVQHHIEICARERSDLSYSGPSHSAPPCPHCGGFTNSRLW